MDRVIPDLTRLRAALYHRQHNKIAHKILRNITQSRSGIGTSTKASCDNYARLRLGWKGFAPWLYVYSAVHGEFKEGWIPDNYYGTVVLPSAKGAHGAVSQLKTLSRRLLGTDALPDLSYFVNGKFYNLDNSPIPLAQVKKTLFRDHSSIVFKQENSQQGAGIYFFDQANLDISTIVRLGNGVFQKIITQHAALDAFTANSTSTIRMTTVIDPSGMPSLRACYIRFGRATDTHVKSKSHVRVPVNLLSGTLSERGFMSDWSEIHCHPDTNTPFASLTIPNFDACRSLVLALHRRSPFARCIGWDIAIDKNSTPFLLEWNGEHNDIKFSEATQGPCFSDMAWDELWREHKTSR